VFFGEMAAVVTFSLLCSLLVAVTLVPSVSAKLLGRTGRGWGPLHLVADGIGRVIGGLEAAYRAVVRAALSAPWFVVALAVLLLAASVRLVPLVGYELMPDTDEGQIDADIEFPVGTPIEQTGPWMLQLEERARTVIRPEELDSIMTSAGPENWWRTEGSNVGELEINLVPVTERERGIDTIIAALRKELSKMPGADIRVRQGNANILMRIMRGGQDERLVVEVRGHERETAEDLAAQVVALMEAVPGVSHAYLDEEKALQERAVEVDTVRAADLGLSRADVADTLETYVLGRVVTRYRERGDEFDVRVQLREEDRWDVAQLGRLPIQLPGGGSIPLLSVADFHLRSAPSAIEREGQERLIRVLGSVGDRALGDIVADLQEALSDIVVPDGFTVEVAGEQAEQEETFRGLLIGIVLAIFLVYTVMAVQFESLLHPLVIMASVPFAFIGVVAALVVTDTTFNMNSFLGAIVLVGIVVNNAIVLVDTVNQLRRDHGRPLVQAVVEGAGRRLRPILMTTLTTVLAMVPLAMGVGEGSEVQAPLARVVVGGLLVSAMVTLVVVPCLYLLVERGRERVLAEEPERAEVPETA
jgi:HAE1 family hydrophobic/amphiphilic exporter-1